MFCYTHLKNHLKDNDQNITEANIKGRPGFKSRPNQNFSYSSFSAIGKIAAHLQGSCLSLILHRQLQKN